MRIPNINKLKRIDFNEGDYQISKIDTYVELTDSVIDFSDDKAKLQFVNEVKKIIRGSVEYQSMIQFLREKIDMTYCSYFNNVNTSIKGIRIEIHHSPFTLTDIIFIVVNRFNEEGYDADPFMVAHEVMKLHYDGVIGLIPLSETIHELVHNGQVFIPVHFVFGDIPRFYVEYKDYMTDDQKTVLAKNIELSKLMEVAPEILKKKFTYFVVDGMTLPHTIQKGKKNK